MQQFTAPKWFLDTKWETSALFSEIYPFGEEINLSGMVLTPEVFLNTYEGSWDRDRANQKPRLEAIWWDKNEKL